jgi:hypothetical protein
LRGRLAYVSSLRFAQIRRHPRDSPGLLQFQLPDPQAVVTLRRGLPDPCRRLPTHCEREQLLTISLAVCESGRARSTPTMSAVVHEGTRDGQLIRQMGERWRPPPGAGRQTGHRGLCEPGGQPVVGRAQHVRSRRRHKRWMPMASPFACELLMRCDAGHRATAL